MRVMTREEIKKLAELSRIELTEAEIERFTTELSAILSYVSAVQELAGDDVSTEPVLGDRYNVFRPDTATQKADDYTTDILAEMPATEGRYLKVKKILQVE
jgi:aspartyl-tRNA(Asn)/glutamyl-tRNA(Gln) amidotransferase subunit C